MGLISVVWGIVAMLWMLLALVPLLGWGNWFLMMQCSPIFLVVPLTIISAH